MTTFLLVTAFTLILIGVLVLLVTESRAEVRPSTALVYNNIWTGRRACVLPGTEFLIPGIHRILEKSVTLKNEAQDPSKVPLITRDGIELEVDFIIRRLQVGYPDMPTDLEDTGLNRNRLRAAVIKAATAIQYSNRTEAVLTRITALLKQALHTRTYSELFGGADVKDGGKADKKAKDEIQEEVNLSLRTDIVTKDWGFWVEVDLEDYNLPPSLRKAREESSSAEMSGRAIRERAAAAGVDPRWFVIGDAVSSILGGKRTGDKS